MHITHQYVTHGSSIHAMWLHITQVKQFLAIYYKMLQ